MLKFFSNFFVTLGSWLFFAAGVLFLVLYYIVSSIIVNVENKFLKARFGKEYLRHKKEVKIFATKSPELFLYPTPTKKINENLYAVRSVDANFYIYTDGKDAICIDAGFGDDSTIEEFKKTNLNMDSIEHLFLTHGDIDHARGVKLFKNSKIYLGKDEEQMVDGTTPRFLWVYHNLPLKIRHTLLNDGDVIRIGNIEVKAISTPGHTPGSMSYLFNGSTLFTGDILLIRNGNIYPFYPALDMNRRRLNESLKKLAKLKNISMICTGHTGYIKTENYEELMKKWM